MGSPLPFPSLPGRTGLGGRGTQTQLEPLSVPLISPRCRPGFCPRMLLVPKRPAAAPGAGQEEGEAGQGRGGSI
jgi:hypothetical protein